MLYFGHIKKASQRHRDLIIHCPLRHIYDWRNLASVSSNFNIERLARYHPTKRDFLFIFCKTHSLCCTQTLKLQHSGNCSSAILGMPWNSSLVLLEDFIQCIRVSKCLDFPRFFLHQTRTVCFDSPVVI